MVWSMRAVYWSESSLVEGLKTYSPAGVGAVGMYELKKADCGLRRPEGIRFPGKTDRVVTPVGTR